MWQSVVTVNDSSVPPGLSLAVECTRSIPEPTQTCLGTKRLHSDMASFDPPCDSDDDNESTASEKSLECLSVPVPPIAVLHNKRRRVSFGDQAQVTHVERIAKTLWYSRQDLVTMKSEAKRQSRLLNLDATLPPAYGMPLANGSHENSLPTVASTLRCCEHFDGQRGLERWTSQMLMVSRCVTIVRARTEVRLEQINQTILGQKDPQRIADLYKQASSQAGCFARVLGIADEAVLQED